MNRRGFLASLLGLVGAPIFGALPALLAPLRPRQGIMAWKMYTKSTVLNTDWVCRMESDSWEDIHFIANARLS
jgi:hypothetical protein